VAVNKERNKSIRRKKMKNVWMIAVLVLVLSGTCLAVDPLGPPLARYFSSTPNWGIGAEYGSSEIEDLEIGTWLAGSKDDLSLDVSGIYFRGEYVTDSWAAFVRLGMADMDIGGAECCSLTSLLDSGDGFVFGGGGRWTFKKGCRAKWGAILQALYMSPELDDNTGQVGRVTATVGGDLEFFQVRAAAGPTLPLTSDWRVIAYGGPFAGWRSVDLDIDVQMPLNSFSASASDNEFFFGGYAGLAAGILKNLHAFGELQYEDDLGVFVGGVFYW